MKQNLEMEMEGNLCEKGMDTEEDITNWVTWNPKVEEWTLYEVTK